MRRVPTSPVPPNRRATFPRPHDGRLDSITVAEMLVLALAAELQELLPRTTALAVQGHETASHEMCLALERAITALISLHGDLLVFERSAMSATTTTTTTEEVLS
jgi:hypothetical protein